MPEYNRLPRYDAGRTIRGMREDARSIINHSKGSAEYSYAVTWGGTTTMGTTGTSTVLGTYSRVGKFCSMNAKIVVGAGTTLPTGAWYVTLPFPPDLSLMERTGSAVAFDSSASQGVGGASIIDSNLGVLKAYFSLGASVTGTVPFAWTTSDALWMECRYPVLEA